jgi:hypothetical protein
MLRTNSQIGRQEILTETFPYSVLVSAKAHLYDHVNSCDTYGLEQIQLCLDLCLQPYFFNMRSSHFA